MTSSDNWIVMVRLCASQRQIRHTSQPIAALGWVLCSGLLVGCAKPSTPQTDAGGTTASGSDEDDAANSKDDASDGAGITGGLDEAGSQADGNSGEESAADDDDGDEGPTVIFDVLNMTESGGEEDDGDSETEDCPDVKVNFDPVTPTVIMLIDQSQSMLNHLDNADPTSPLRWNALDVALFDPDRGAIAALDDRVRFGMALYTATDSGNMDPQGCPMLVEVEPAMDNFEAMRDSFGASTPLHNTPTPDSLLAISEQLAQDPDDGPKYIILATDGDPDTCEQPNPNQGHAEAIAAAAAAHDAGHTTFIISVGPELSADHLQAMADAGAGTPGSPFFEANDQDGLIDAFADILDIVRDCVFTLDQKIVPGFESKGTVLINGEEIPYDDPDGWTVIGPQQIELLGAACESIQSGTVAIDISFPCDGVIPPG